MNDNIEHAKVTPPELASLLEKAAELYGHLGPFLAIGVRMGLIGLQKIGKRDCDKLTIDARATGKACRNYTLERI
jgi:formylmethanofuran dehydrogenase subunit E